MDSRSPATDSHGSDKIDIGCLLQPMVRRHMPITKRSGQTMGWSSITGNNVSPHTKQSTKAMSAKSFGLTTTTSSKSTWLTLHMTAWKLAQLWCSQAGVRMDVNNEYVQTYIHIREVAQSQSNHSLVLSGWQERLILCILANRHVIHRRPYQQSLWPYQTSLLQQWWKMWIGKLPARAHATEIHQPIDQVIYHSVTKKHIEDWWC